MRHHTQAGPGLFLLCLLGLVFLAPSGISHHATARQATPAPLPLTADCDVAPRPIGELLGTSEGTPIAGSSVRPLPTGRPADAATTAAIAATLQEMSACLTAGQMLRFYALHSDTWLQRFTAGIPDLTTYTASTPPLDDGQSARYLGPWHVQILPDGRVMAAVLLRIGNELRPDPKRVRVLMFVQEDGRWLVDETIEMVTIADCAFPVAVAAIVGPPPGAVFDAWSAGCDEES